MLPVGDRREFHQILASLTERPLTAWEHERLWQLLERHPRWVSEYVAHCEFPALLAETDRNGASAEAPIIPLHDTPSRVPAGVRRPHRTMVTGVLSAFAAFVLFVALSRFASDRTVAHEAPSDTAESPQQTYDRISPRLPARGSLSRPAANTESLATSRDGTSVDFDAEIRPILSENCFGCHGPGTQKAGLRLDTFAGATKDLAGSVAIKPGKPQDSEAIKRIETADPDDLMPPPDSHKVLKPNEKTLLRRWIAEGATYRQHWAFDAPRRPPVPKDPSGWARNPIDALVLAPMKKAGLSPNPEADRRDLARRAALDVIGLPPTPEQVEAFVVDARPDAWDRYLDGLFASPHYGEHRARAWLDVARYGDTHGMHLDNYREMWPYRDWVIQALNDNMPFDRFITEQLAGDLLPGAGESQRIATGFSRCHISTSEGGSIPEEVRVRYMIDQTDTFSTAFLGLTSVCASCHDHKYDPIPQKEMYALAAFFNNTTEPAMDGNRKDAPPSLVLPSRADRPEWDRLMERRRVLFTEMARRREGLFESGAFAGWAARFRRAQHEPAHPVAADALQLWMPFEVPARGATDSLAYWTPAGMQRLAVGVGVKPAEDSPTGRGVVFTGKDPIRIPGGLAIDSGRPFTISFWVRPPVDTAGGVLLGSPEERFVVGGKKKTQRRFHMDLLAAGSVHTILQRAQGDMLTAAIEDDAGLSSTKWQHVVVRYSGANTSGSFDYRVDGQLRTSRAPFYATGLRGPLRVRQALEVGRNAETVGFSDLRIFNRMLSDEEVALLALGTPKAPVRGAPEEQLRSYHANVVDAEGRRLSRELMATQKQRDAIASRSPTTLVMEERQDRAPSTFVLDRGEYDKHKEEVTANVFSALPPLPEGAPRNRLGLARWVTMRENPLTARVLVNRVWQEIFGIGLVRTAGDFGMMGERPSHPALLDWLAVEFIESGWDMKKLVRLILNSATYRQSAQAGADKRGLDPENRLLARGPRLRLDAEVMRDQALAVSGLLVPTIGGPSVKPYQPDGLWSAVAVDVSNTAKFVQDHGDKLYRRSLYTFWKRTSPPASLAAFDAPTRESCTVRRERTNTPLQALVLMNDPQFVEAARQLATRAVREHDGDGDRVAAIFKRITGRSPDDGTRRLLVDAARGFREAFASNQENARALISTGESPTPRDIDAVELATWTMVGNTLLNRDDVINKN